jgi:pimeloyl-ACP methyl ester carboxylesterase
MRAPPIKSRGTSCERADLSNMLQPVLRPKMLTVALTLVGAYLLMAGLVTVYQRKMIYHPLRYPADAMRESARGRALEPWTNANGQPVGWKRPSLARPAPAQVLVLHGNAGCALDRVDYADGLQAAGSVDVFILEYPGYGDRAGVPSQESLLTAAREGFQLLASGGRVFLLGESLGTGVAAYLAGTFPNSVAGVMLLCPFNNLAAVGQCHMPLFPVKWMLLDRFPAEKWLAHYPGPAGFLVATEDTIVPARFGRRLYDVYNGRKKLWEIAQAGHNDVFNRPTAWWREVLEFWGEKPVPK